MSELYVSKKAFFNSIMFLRKTNQLAIRKVADFRLLNAYARTWKTHFPRTLATFRVIPVNWKVYTSIDILQGYFHILVCEVLSSLFAFEYHGKRYKYKCLP